ncbi:hypothetical protein EKO27_g5088 [Xylaria grammica]|uniref:UBC core domain-containing protein n=1 Tax=Xylaria grammica TaxID=363999 RepID=A0A439D6J9_9PEZI|nr:hypothetical protein EKO27_g5088 [Xylaria grammica]
MASQKFSTLPALRRQHLLAEFAGLKQVCPDGVYVALTPGDPNLWSGVIFVRDGPYAPAVLRFQISFPDSYPKLPPLVTFSTDIFHPLITPLSTYMYSTDVQSNGTSSATDEERLPPGGFSLRHGFPTCTFDDEDVLDTIPLDAAGNPGAWHAWRTHRIEKGKEFESPPTLDDVTATVTPVTSPGSARKPGEWNWEGVWEERVKKGISTCLSEPVMFGGVGAADDVIRFLNMGEDDLNAIKENLLRTVDHPS